MNAPRQTLGVLGGMGPSATAEFLRLLAAHVPGTADQQHPRIVMLSDPSVPDRTAALLGGLEAPLPPIRDGLATLTAWGADVLAVPCNTAHVYIDRLRGQLDVPLVHIVEETLRKAMRTAPGGGWLAATTGTVVSGLYQRRAEALGYRLLLPDAATQEAVHYAATLVKANRTAEAGHLFGTVVRPTTRERQPMTLRAHPRRTRRGAWTARMRAARGEPAGRVVVFPHGGAGPNALMPLLACLPESLDLLGVTLPGRERRSGESYQDMPGDPAAVVAAIVEELVGLPARPTVFFGHSMGVAVAVATALAEPALCDGIVISSHPPRGARVERAGEFDESTLLDIIRLGGGTPPAILDNAMWRAHVVGVLRSDLTLGARLVRRNLLGRLSAPLTVLGGDRDELVGTRELTGWAARTEASTRLRVYPGGHFYLLDDANRDDVAAEIVTATTP